MPDQTEIEVQTGEYSTRAFELIRKANSSHELTDSEKAELQKIQTDCVVCRRVDFVATDERCDACGRIVGH